MEKKKILIVDDAKFLRHKLIEIIDKIEYAEVVGEAENGIQAINLYKELKPDLVTMDLIMPEMGGIEAIEKIVEYDKEAKIVVISIMGKEEKALEAAEKGAKDYIEKPFQEEQVIKVLHKYLLN
ncbi:MAG: response regulator [Candidatus Lokiarchaeota archaeon]|nr:response regulator [Candidatus Lokiarchaeota archaeon]